VSGVPNNSANMAQQKPYFQLKYSEAEKMNLKWKVL